MSDWTGFLQTDEYRQYRKQQALLIAKLIKSEVEKAVFKNDIIKSILRFPEQLTTDEGVRANLENQLLEDIGNIVKYLMRDALRESE